LFPCQTLAPVKGKSVTFRPRADLRQRLELLALATERPMTFLIEKAVEGHLPELEKKYAREIQEWVENNVASKPEKKTSYSTALPLRRSSPLELNEPKPKPAK
jgi:predicted transcriptional regulator